MTNTERRRRRRRMRHTVKVSVLVLLTVTLVAVIGVRAEYAKQNKEQDKPSVPEITTAYAATPEPVATAEPAKYSKPATEPLVLHLPSPAEELAKMVWGEARGCSLTEQAACVWCALNRVDAGMGDIVEVVQAPYQFSGYRADNPVDEKILALVNDVLIRWRMEESCIGNVGRVLPKDYLWFSGDGVHNYFRNAYKGGEKWNWSLRSPYEGVQE